MTKIYSSKMLGPVIFLLRLTTAFAKKHAAEPKVLHESSPLPSLKHILNCVAIGITTELNATFALTAKPAAILIPSLTDNGKAGLRFSRFIQFTHLEFRS